MLLTKKRRVTDRETASLRLHTPRADTYTLPGITRADCGVSKKGIDKWGVPPFCRKRNAVLLLQLLTNINKKRERIIYHQPNHSRFGENEYLYPRFSREGQN